MQREEREWNDIRLDKFVTEENRKTVLLMRGVHFKTDYKQVQKFLSRVVDIDIPKIKFENSRGKKTGFVLILLPSEEHVESAIMKLDKTYLGTSII